jgi:hypothetical protein
MATVFRATKSQDIQVGDVEMQIVEEKRKYVYYYHRAESVFVGDKAEPIHDPMTGAFVGNRTTNLVEIVWKPLNHDGKQITLQYQPTTTLSIASNVADVSELTQEEEATE